MVPPIVAAGYLSGPIAIAMTQTGLMVIMVMAVLLVVARMRYALLLDLPALIWHPAIASVAMWMGIHYMPELGGGGHALSLIRVVLVGAGVFTGTVVLLWLAARRPDGAERIVLNFAPRRAR